MSVRKLWVAGDASHSVEYTADTASNAIEPIGAVIREDTAARVDVKNMEQGLAQVVRVASLCNVATYVQTIIRMSLADFESAHQYSQKPQG